jgi:hypothetical protein
LTKDAEGAGFLTIIPIILRKSAKRFLRCAVGHPRFTIAVASCT